MGGIYDKFIHKTLSQPFIERRFPHKSYEDKGISMESLPMSIIRFDPYVRGKMFGYSGPNIWYREVSW
jgi:hypothetical protein